MDRNAYNEKLSSAKTETLFILLTLIFLALFTWRWLNVGWNGWTIAFLCFFAFFLFYSLNYRTLKIQLSPETLQLTFGIFTWKITISNIKNCYLDEDTFWRFGGAGIHFMWIKGKYRAFFNFLEYPRVVVTLKEKKGLVQEVAFTTKRPEQVQEFINRYSS
jgi:Ca2+/Na+ antiporter